MIQTIHETIKKHNMLDGCGNIIAGLSGGSDSVCMLYALKNTVGDSYPAIQLTAVHVNHMLRGEDADRDEEYCADLCEKLNIPLVVKKVDAAAYGREHKISEEMAGREIRYSIFQEVAKGLTNCKIAIAHNLDDRVETVLMNIIRGTGTSGLKGIPYVR